MGRGFLSWCVFGLALFLSVFVLKIRETGGGEKREIFVESAVGCFEQRQVGGGEGNVCLLRNKVCLVKERNSKRE